MCEIADDHQSIVAEQMAEGVGGFTSSKNVKSDDLPRKQVDWDAYFHRNRENLRASVAARAVKRQNSDQ